MLPALLAGVGAGEARRRAEELLAAVGLAQLGGRRATALSGGERQRGAIARALVNDAPLLLADEPTGNLDSATGAEIVRLLRSLPAARGTTIVLATHSPDLARAADRVVLMRDGRIEDAAGAAAVVPQPPRRHDPASLRLARLAPHAPRAGALPPRRAWRRARRRRLRRDPGGESHRAPHLRRHGGCGGGRANLEIAAGGGGLPDSLFVRVRRAPGSPRRRRSSWGARSSRSIQRGSRAPRHRQLLERAVPELRDRCRRR